MPYNFYPILPTFGKFNFCTFLTFGQFDSCFFFLERLFFGYDIFTKFSRPVDEYKLIRRQAFQSHCDFSLASAMGTALDLIADLHRDVSHLLVHDSRVGLLEPEQKKRVWTFYCDANPDFLDAVLAIHDTPPEHSLGELPCPAAETSWIHRTQRPG